MEINHARQMQQLTLVPFSTKLKRTNLVGYKSTALTKTHGSVLCRLKKISIARSAPVAF